MKKKNTPQPRPTRQKKPAAPVSQFARVVKVPPARTSENDPFVDRLRRLWEAAREHDQHETAQLLQDMLLSYKKLRDRKHRRKFIAEAERPLRELERPYFDDIIDALSEEDD